MLIFGILIPAWLTIPFIGLAILAVLNLFLWLLAPIIGIKIIFKIVKILFRVLRILLPVAVVGFVFYLICALCGASFVSPI